MRIFVTAIIILLGAAFAVPALASDKQGTDAAQRVFDAYGDAIYQIQVMDIASGKKNGIGSGFQFTADGLLATNYHVVSGAIRRPHENRIEFLHDKYGKGALTIMAADVVHDLAILKMEKPGDVHVQLGTQDLRKGARLFALGNPRDIGFTIIEGTYNGFLQDSFIDKIHFSGSLNPGMSGGPALSHDGLVYGINVATAGNQISFLVPVEALRALHAQMPEEGWQGNDGFIEDQLLAQQKKVIDTILAADWDAVPFGPLMVPGRVHDAVRCWGESAHEERDPFRYTRSACATQDNIYIDDGFVTGKMTYRYEHMAGRGDMTLPRFYGFYEAQYRLPPGEALGREDDVENFDCNTRFVNVAQRVWKASLCVRPYRRYKDLYDMQMHMAMLAEGMEGLLISLDMKGLSRENIRKVAGRFLSSVTVPEKDAR
ncbi:MAG: serine protease [Alphaproteobacteria bacterium]|nr:serine protease [Alphaproteobacteria bacterium]